MFLAMVAPVAAAADGGAGAGGGDQAALYAEALAACEAIASHMEEVAGELAQAAGVERAVLAAESLALSAAVGDLRAAEPTAAEAEADHAVARHSAAGDGGGEGDAVQAMPDLYALEAGDLVVAGPAHSVSRRRLRVAAAKLAGSR